LQKIIDESSVKDKIQVIVNPDYTTKLELFRKCTYVAIFSRFEGWCIVAIEAAAAGKAILGVDVEGLRDSVVNEFNGILVKDFDQNELINYGKKLLTDKTFRAHYERNARIHASKYTWEKIAEMQMDVYQEHLRSI
jgi:glycosyltransferase involved in cell wall biosynthesis